MGGQSLIGNVKNAFSKVFGGETEQPEHIVNEADLVDFVNKEFERRQKERRPFE